MSRFRKVACNTKVDLLAGPKFFRHPLLAQVEAAVSRPLERLIAEAQPLPGSVDPSNLGWTNLGACKDIFDAITQAFLSEGAAHGIRGHVDRLTYHGGQWIASVCQPED